MNGEVQSNAGAQKVVIVGGGLAGLAAAAGLVNRGLQVELLEATQTLGGRAGSYREAESGELIDHCQHVAMGGCTNFLDLCARTGCGELLERHRRLYFFSADGQRSDFAAFPWLPAPLHLLPALMGMKHLTWRDKFGIGRAMVALLRMKPADGDGTVLAWLTRQRQTPAAIERFWKVVLVSALADSLDHISLQAARKVFIDGFLAHPTAADVLIPSVSLGELYDQRMSRWLREQGVTITRGESVKQISQSGQQLLVQTAARELVADAVISAVPWQHVSGLLAPQLLAALPELSQLDEFSSSPISSVHLRTDRALMDLPHVVLMERVSQWVFARKTSTLDEFSYQVVISGTHALSGQPKQAIIDEVWRDLQAVFPAARKARLIRAKLIMQREAVFRETRDGHAHFLLSHSCAVPQLVFAGDWLNDGWYSTMEGAVRSGYRAAERILKELRGDDVRILQPGLSRSWFVRWLIRT